MSWIHGSGWSQAAVRVLLHIAVFLVVGPIVEGCIFVLFIVPDMGLKVFFPAYILTAAYIMIFLSYIFGGIPAAFTGLLVAIASTRILRSRWLFLFAATIGGALTVANFIIDGSPQDPSLFGQHSIYTDMAVFFAVAATAAVVCTHLMKRFRVNNNVASGQATLLPGLSA